MKVNDVIAYFGTPKATAEAFKTDRSTVSKWLLKELMPLSRAIEAEVISQGGLVFDKAPYIEAITKGANLLAD